MKRFLLSRFIYYFYRTLMMTWRIRLDVSQDYEDLLSRKKPTILAHFHGDELALLPMVHRYGLCTMTSTSKDGAIIDFVIQKLGGNTARGSSSRGAVSGLKGMLRLVKNGHPGCLAIDGPRGPIYKVKPGVFEISRLSSAPIFTMTAHANYKKVFEKAWNKTYLPLPFSRVDIQIKKSFDAIQKGDDPRSKVLAEKLEYDLNISRQYLADVLSVK